jgi:hypothetical protein
MKPNCKSLTFNAFMIVMLFCPILTRAEDIPGLPAQVVKISPPVSTASYKTLDFGNPNIASDDKFGITNWRIVKNTGNCCENYLATTRNGRLLDFGGSYINFSDDRGLTWSSVRPVQPLVNGEGAIAVAPNGDVVGVEWDPYSGDHLVSFKYDASKKEWRYLELPLHQPFYDRQWIAVLPGPFTIDGITVPYLTFLKGGVPKELWFYSLDGLSYVLVTSKFIEQLGNDSRRTLTPAAPNTEFDPIQPNTNGGMFPVSAVRMLASGDLDSNWSLFDSTERSWTDVIQADGTAPRGRYAVDSAGRLHNVIPQGAQFIYRWSSDGGKTWRSVNGKLPENWIIEQLDFRANKYAGVAAVMIRAQDTVSGNDGDLVYKIGIKDAQPKLLRRYQVGLADINSTAGLGSEVRMDFQTLAIFNDGRLAVSFLDSTTELQPAVAVELDTKISGPAQGPSTTSPPGVAQGPIVQTVIVPAPGAGQRVCAATSGCLEFTVPAGADDASMHVEATPATPADVDLYLQRKLDDGTWSADIVTGTSGSLSNEQLDMGRLTPGATYRIEAHLWAGLPGTSIALTATFFNSAGVAGL